MTTAMTAIRGKVWKFGDSMSTDLMEPGLLHTIDLSEKERAQYTFYGVRPGWAKEVQEGDIIVAGKNFGCGSSRPAPRQFKTLGISVIISESMSRIFFRNAVNIGLPVLICPGITQLLEEGNTAEVNIETAEVRNTGTGKSIHGEALPSDTPPAQILRAGGLDNFLKEVAANLDAWRK